MRDEGERALVTANQSTDSKRRLRIMFASPYCLLDPSSGASQSCRAILERLAARGHKAIALGGTIFDRPLFKTPETFLERVGAEIRSKGPIVTGHRTHAGVRHVLLRVRSQRRKQMTAEEEGHFYRMLEFHALKSPPDIVLTYGGQISDLASYRLLRDRGIPVVFYLANENYRGRGPFRDVAAVITDSRATAELYKKRLGIDVMPVGKFVRAFPSSPGDRREYCTFINPSPEKGVSLFAALAKESHRRGLDAKFLVIESRARLAPMVERLGMSMDELPNVTCWPIQTQMSKVWTRTKLLLHPALWHESGSRSILEALSAHLPCLATRSGGNEQMMGDSGFLFPHPLDAQASKKREYMKPFPPEVVSPWVDQLQALLSDAALYASERERARIAWETHEYRDDIERVERIFFDLLREPT